MILLLSLSGDYDQLSMPLLPCFISRVTFVLDDINSKVKGFIQPLLYDSLFIIMSFYVFLSFPSYLVTLLPPPPPVLPLCHFLLKPRI